MTPFFLRNIEVYFIHCLPIAAENCLESGIKEWIQKVFMQHQRIDFHAAVAASVTTVKKKITTTYQFSIAVS